MRYFCKGYTDGKVTKGEPNRIGSISRHSKIDFGFLWSIADYLNLWHPETNKQINQLVMAILMMELITLRWAKRVLHRQRWSRGRLRQRQGRWRRCEHSSRVYVEWYTMHRGQQHRNQHISFPRHCTHYIVSCVPRTHWLVLDILCDQTCSIRRWDHDYVFRQTAIRHLMNCDKTSVLQRRISANHDVLYKSTEQ